MNYRHGNGVALIVQNFKSVGYVRCIGLGICRKKWWYQDHANHLLNHTESTGHSDETNWDEKTANVLMQVDGAPAAPHRIIPVLTRLECSEEAKAWSW